MGRRTNREGRKEREGGRQKALQLNPACHTAAFLL